MARSLKPEIFDWLASTPDTWFGSADTLLKSAAHVWRRRNEIPHSVWVALMLRGYAVENLLKGLWVQRSGEVATSGKIEWNGSFRNHDLVGMAREIDLACGQSYENVLATLANAILFLGRYPIPLRCGQMPVHTDQEPDEKAIWCPEYEDRFWLLVNELSSRFEFLKKLPETFLDTVMTTTWQIAYEP